MNHYETAHFLQTKQLFSAIRRWERLVGACLGAVASRTRFRKRSDSGVDRALATHP
jgi:hypothetical protein